MCIHLNDGTLPWLLCWLLLAQVSLPLARSLEFLQEDVESMSKEYRCGPAAAQAGGAGAGGNDHVASNFTPRINRPSASVTSVTAGLCRWLNLLKSFGGNKLAQ